jgi:hypothetical protein
LDLPAGCKFACGLDSDEEKQLAFCNAAWSAFDLSEKGQGNEKIFYRQRLLSKVCFNHTTFSPPLSGVTVPLIIWAKTIENVRSTTTPTFQVQLQHSRHRFDCRNC